MAELLLIFWGVLFVAAKGEPDLRSRNLKKTAQRGVGGIAKGAISVASVVGSRHPIEQKFRNEEVMPNWDDGADPTARCEPLEVAYVGGGGGGGTRALSTSVAWPKNLQR